MCAEAVECVDGRAHSHRFAENLYAGCTLNELSAKRTLCLVTHDHYDCIRLGQAMFQMMQNAPRIAHAGASHDQTGARHIVQFHRVLSCRCWYYMIVSTDDLTRAFHG